MRFQYEILIGDRDNSPHGVNWRLASNVSKNLGNDLLRILNELGALGWEVTGIAPIYFDPSQEIILKRQVQ